MSAVWPPADDHHLQLPSVLRATPLTIPTLSLYIYIYVYFNIPHMEPTLTFQIYLNPKQSQSKSKHNTWIVWHMIFSQESPHGWSLKHRHVHVAGINIDHPNQ